ncbi:MAG: hypothetical protein ACLQPD_26330 [Desulfomonilaceae bacterium]
MEPKVAKLSDKVDEIDKGQEELRKSLLSLRESDLLQIKNDLLQISQSVAALESDVKLVKKIGPVVYVAALIVLTILGMWSLSEWKKSVAGDISKEAKQKLDNELRSDLDQSLFLSADIEQMMRGVDKKNKETLRDPLNRLRSVAKDQSRREYIFRRYIDLLILGERYKEAFEFLQTVEAKKIFPDSYNFSKTFSAAAFVMWVQSFYDHANWTNEEALALVKKARKSLKDAKEKAEINPFQTEADKDMKTYYYYSFLFNLSEKKDGEAKNDLKDFLNLNGEFDWKEISQDDWFERLLIQRPHVRTLLEGMCKKTFPSGITTKGNI